MRENSSAGGGAGGEQRRSAADVAAERKLWLERRSGNGFDGGG